jgi:transposase InsO family protein
VYAAIAAIIAENGWATEAACDVLNVSRSAYYAWCEREPSRREQRAADLTPLVRALFWKHRRRYGARRIAADLADLGKVCSRRWVGNIMKTEGLRAIQPKSFVPKTTDSRHLLGYSPNLILDTPEPSGINQLWVGDITYVPLRGGAFCYLASLLDRFSRDIVGWELDETMTDELTLAALRMAIRERQPPALLVHHTDRGGQYASNRYRAVLHRAAMRQSMSRAGNVYDNAFMESCFGTLKTELEMTEYDDYRTARREIAEYIDYYRSDRKHSALGYLSPRQFERLAPFRS